MLPSCKKINRGTYTQSDATRLRVISNAAGENLLLRHSYREKNQRSLCLDNEVDALLDRRLRFDKLHRESVNHNMEARVSVSQRGTSRCRRANDCYCETLLRCACNEICRQITACNDGKPATAEPSQAAQHAAIAEHAPCPLVERLHPRGILKQSYDVVHVRRYDIPETSMHLSENIASNFFDRPGIETRPEEINAFSGRHGVPPAELSRSKRILDRDEIPFALSVIKYQSFKYKNQIKYIEMTQLNIPN
jgi:hypothetical protein